MKPISTSTARDWVPTGQFESISTVDAHAEGEPLRVVTGGIEKIPGETILEKRRYAHDHLDWLRRVLMFEPRGHADMYGAIVTEPVTTDSRLGVLFMHNEGWSTMCGHGIIALVTVAIETGMISWEDVIKIDTPAGNIRAFPSRSDTGVEAVTFENVPSFVVSLDDTVDVPGLGEIHYDLAFGGAFYAFVKAADMGVKIVPENARKLIDLGLAIKKAVMRDRAITHPSEADLSFLYGTIIVSPALSDGANSRNACIFADGEMDRSPTGTGVSARVAIESLKGNLREGEDYIVESILGTRFVGRIVGKTKVDQYEAVIPSVSGRAWLTGKHQFLISKKDPLKGGFIIR